MEFARIKNIFIKLIISFILITLLNFLITGQIKKNYALLSVGASDNFSLNEDIYHINTKNTLTKDNLLKDINDIEIALSSEYEASANDSEQVVEYYKKIYDLYDARLMYIYNSISERMNNERDKSLIYNDLYNFKIKRIDDALSISDMITDNKKRLSEYYKSLSEQTKAKCIEFVNNYVAFLDK